MHLYSWSMQVSLRLISFLESETNTRFQLVNGVRSNCLKRPALNGDLNATREDAFFHVWSGKLAGSKTEIEQLPEDQRTCSILIYENLFLLSATQSIRTIPPRTFLPELIGPYKLK